MRIERMILGMIQEQAYFIIDEASKRAFIVDPGDEANKIMSKINQEGLKLEKILLTHGHFDHIGAVEALKQATGAEVVCHTQGPMYLADPAYNLSGMMGGPSFTVKADTFVEAGETVVMEGTDIALKVIHVPGHTVDSIAYYSEQDKVAFVGDIIFQGSVGRTDFPGGNAALLISSIQENLFVLEQEVTLYPGHGPATTVGREKLTNPYFNLFD